MTTSNELAVILVGMKSMLHRRYVGKLRKISHREDTDDLFQVTAMNAHAALPRCRAETTEEIQRWVMTIAANAVRSKIRSHKASRKRSIEQEDTSLEFAHPTSEDRQVQRVFDKEQLKFIHDCIDRMNRRARPVFVDRVIYGMSYEELSEKHQIDIKPLRSLVYRNIQFVKNEMQQRNLPGFDLPDPGNDYDPFLSDEYDDLHDN